MEAIPAAEFALVAKKSLSDDAFGVIAIQLRDPQQVEDDAIPISQTVFDWVFTEKVTLVSQNLGEDQRFESSESIRIHDLRSIICVPICGQQKVLGLLYAQANNLLSPFTREDAKFVSAVANEMALNIDNLRLRKDMLRNERMAAIAQYQKPAGRQSGGHSADGQPH
jgi:GAF domain-containing protein